MFYANHKFALLISGQLLICTAVPCASSSAVSDAPLVVDEHSHVVVMEYEAWWGPKAVTFQGTAAKPLLQSADMQAVGGGYDSADPAIIQQHVAWLEYMGVDAAISEFTNNVSCIFNSEWFAKKYLPYCSPSFRVYNQSATIPAIFIRHGQSWELDSSSFRCWVALTRMSCTKTSTTKPRSRKKSSSFGSLLQKYPQRQVIYKGKPLMLIYIGAAQDPNRADNPLWFQIRTFLKNHPGIARKYTFRMMAGYLDAQPGLWATQGTPDGPWRSIRDTASGAGLTGSRLRAPPPLSPVASLYDG